MYQIMNRYIYNEVCEQKYDKEIAEKKKNYLMNMQKNLDGLLKWK
jgi:hypothetical protein